MKKIGKALLFPPLPLILLLAALSGYGLWQVFSTGQETSFLAYGSYALSFYTLTVLCLYGILVLPKVLPRWKQRFHQVPFFHRYLTDRMFRAKCSLYLSLSLNLAHVGVQLVQWYGQRSWWFLVLGGYYSILSLMRFLLVGYVQKHTIGAELTAEWKCSRTCGWILLLVNLSLSGAVLMMLYQNRGYHYGEYTIYLIALYTFYAVIHAVVEIFKSRRRGSPILTTARSVSLSAALVSMLNLESAMLSQFGRDMDGGSKYLFIALTGAGISILILFLSGRLIVKATHEIRSVNYGTQ